MWRAAFKEKRGHSNEPPRRDGASGQSQMIRGSPALRRGRRSKTKEGRGEFRLPSEAEWEYAARAGTTTARFWGDDTDDACAYANVRDLTLAKAFSWSDVHDCDDGYAVTAPVGRFQPNAFGLYDMLGNVWEWCQDTYHENYNGAPSDGSIWGSLGDEKANRLLRGGSWNDEPYNVRSANRDWLAPELQFDVIGIRLVFSRTP